MESWTIDRDSDTGSDAGDHREDGYHTQDEGIASVRGSTVDRHTDLHAMRNLNNLEGKIRWLESIFKNWPSSRSEAFRVEIMQAYYNMLFSTLGLGERHSESPASGFTLRGSQLNPELQDRLTNSAAEFLMNTLARNDPFAPVPTTTTGQSAPVDRASWQPGTVPPFVFNSPNFHVPPPIRTAQPPPNPSRPVGLPSDVFMSRAFGAPVTLPEGSGVIHDINTTQPPLGLSSTYTLGAQQPFATATNMNTNTHNDNDGWA